jgi:hypothetical protein
VPGGKHLALVATTGGNEALGRGLDIQRTVNLDVAAATVGAQVLGEADGHALPSLSESSDRPEPAPLPSKIDVTASTPPLAPIPAFAETPEQTSPGRTLRSPETIWDAIADLLPVSHDVKLTEPVPFPPEIDTALPAELLASLPASAEAPEQTSPGRQQ